MARTWIAIAALLASCAVALAEEPPKNPPLTPSPVKRTIISKTEVPNSNYEMTTAIVEVAPGFKAPRHIHPGLVTAYVIDGACWFAPDGQPEKVFHAGETVELPERAVHVEGAAGADAPCKMYVVYVLDKGAPLAVLVK
jgi:quercetin dioxygenase-like cupin family protein